MRSRMCSGVVDGSQTVLLDALTQMALTGVARLGSRDVPTAVGEAHHDEFGAPQIPPVDLLEDGSFGMDGAIRVAASPRARAHPIRCKRQELAPLQHEGDMELRVVGLADTAEADERFDLALRQLRHLVSACIYRSGLDSSDR
jgi:hypothetical protein